MSIASIPAEQYVTKTGTSAFSNFSVGDTVIVKKTDNNDGIYTVTSITTDDVNSYMGLAGQKIIKEIDQTDVEIKILPKTGNKLIAFGDEESGRISVWSYNESSSSGGTVKEAPEIGTTGWSVNAIRTTIDGDASKFVFTPGQSALRVCDITETNDSVIKRFSYFNITQFASANTADVSYSTERADGAFLGWQEHENSLPMPTRGFVFIGHEGDGTFAIQDLTDGTPTSNKYDMYSLNDSKAFFGIAENSKTTPLDSHLRCSLNGMDLGTTSNSVQGKNGRYRTYWTDQANLVEFDSKNPDSSQKQLYVMTHSLAKIPIGAVIGVSNEEGIVDAGTTFQAERMLVKNKINYPPSLIVERGYGITEGAEIDIDATPWLVQYGTGFNIAVEAADEGSGFYTEGTYEFAQSFVYDGNQESLLRTRAHQLSAYNTSLTIGDLTDEVGRNTNFCSLRVRVAAFGPYPARITGGRWYIREAGTSEPWSLLVDIDIVKGCRSSLDADFKPWISPYSENATDSESSSLGAQLSLPNGCFRCGGYGNTNAVISKRLSEETYSTINNYYPDIKGISIGKKNEGYACSTIGGERAWYGNIKLMNSNGNIQRYGDRIMWSEFRKYDVIPHLNWFTSSSGDADDIVELKFFSDKLLVFKANSLHVWNVSASNDPSRWTKEDVVNYAGIHDKCNVTETPFGIIWVNRNGCYYFDGRSMKNLIEGKIRNEQNSPYGAALPPSWSTFVQNSSYIVKSMPIFNAKDKQLYILKDSTEASTSDSNQCYIYNFLTDSWVFNQDIFTHTTAYTNPVYDWNGNTVLAYEDLTDTGLNLDANFDKDNKIAAAIDQSFDTSGGTASSNWTATTTTGDYGAPNTFTDIDTSGSTDRLKIISSADDKRQGCILADARINALTANETYIVRVKLEVESAATEDSNNNRFFVSLCGKEVEIGNITHDRQAYHEVFVTITSGSGDLQVYAKNESGGTQTWYIYEVSVKSASLNVDGIATRLVHPNDTLRIDSEDFLVRTIVDGADEITVTPAYNGTTAADHSSGADIYIRGPKFKQISTSSATAIKSKFITKDFDFENPSRIKKVYKFHVTYKNTNGSDLSNCFRAAVNGSTTHAQSNIPNMVGSNATLNGTFTANTTNWDIATFSFSHPLGCQSLSLYFNASGADTGIYINDISVEYRIINKMVS